MSGPALPQPNLVDYLAFIRNVMGISADYLPAISPQIQHSFDASKNWVNDDLGVIVSQTTSWSIYAQAIYNLGGHLLIEYAADQSYAISAASWAAGLVTITTAMPNAFSVNDPIVVTGISPSGYNGNFAVNSIIDDSNLTYARTATAAAQLGAMLVGVPAQNTPATSVAGATVSGCFFQRARQNFKLNGQFVAGVPTSASDQGTSVGLMVPDSLRNLDLWSLNLLKTPYGQTYLRIAQAYGPNVWGLS